MQRAIKLPTSGDAAGRCATETYSGAEQCGLAAAPMRPRSCACAAKTCRKTVRWFSIFDGHHHRAMAPHVCNRASLHDSDTSAPALTHGVTRACPMAGNKRRRLDWILPYGMAKLRSAKKSGTGASRLLLGKRPLMKEVAARIASSACTRRNLHGRLGVVVVVYQSVDQSISWKGTRHRAHTSDKDKATQSR